MSTAESGNDADLELSKSTSSVGNSLTDANSRFPCVEQPIRVTLHCNGYYLWCKRNGNVIIRKRRNEKDEFRLEYDEQGTLQIRHHKFGFILTVVKETLDDGTLKHSVVGIKPKEEGIVPVASQSDQITIKDDKDEDDNGLNPPPLSFNVQEEDKKWCFIKIAGSNSIMLKSLSLGLNLGISNEGRLTFGHDDANSEQIMWTIECVTGELCFMSNPSLNGRVRCDMAGMLSLSDNTKGWEVFRFMEASHGYVKISSWMHSQWLLCSSADGRVDTCSHAESFQDYRQDLDGKISSMDFRCSKWAIEKAPSGKGVVIRSKTHGRFLSVRDNGELKTYHPDDDIDIDKEDDDDDLLKEQREKMVSGASWKSFKDSIRKSIQTKANPNVPIVPEVQTIVWNIEAAHSQNYYFFSLDLQDPNAKAKSMGPFPQVSPNLRKNTKIQLIQGDENITKLCLETEEKKEIRKQYIICTHDQGKIALVDDITDPNTEWIMDKSQYQEGGTFFKSRLHSRYLSYKKSSPPVPDVGKQKEDTPADKLKELFQKEQEEFEELYGSETIGMEETWKLDPCMPRAVSSDKIKTFALGTSIAVGTTVAMPFALAGVGAIMGALGAEVGTMTAIVFAGLTGAEAIASVGAIGATAYIVFRPAENSLTDDHKNDDETEQERAWSQRPFSNWRNW